MTPTAMTAAQIPELRAAGTDLSERRRSGVSKGPLIDISATPDSIGMHWGSEGSLRIGALTTNCGIERERVSGLHQHPSGPGPRQRSYLHVSAGLGTSPYAPVRFFCRPEATLLTLVPRIG